MISIRPKGLRIQYAAAAGLALLAAPARAMFPPTSAAQVGLNALPRGLSAPSGEGLGATVLVRYGERSRLRAGTEDRDNPSGEGSAQLRATLLLDRRVWRRLSAVLVLPYVRNEARSGGRTETASGLGDLTLLARVSVLKGESLAPRELFLIAGAELPTGRTHAKDSSGQRLPLSQQPGSDSLDWMFGAAGVWSLWDVSLYADATYKRAGRETYTFGDAAAVNLGANLPLLFAPKASVAAELSAEFAGRDRSRFGGPGVLPDGTVRDTGGETLSIAPSVQWRPVEGASLSAGVQVPLHQNLRGVQLKAGLTTHLSASVRFGASR